MQPTRTAAPSSSTQVRWKALTAAERATWTAWREAHPDPAWRPLCGAILESGFRLPPTEPETAILWPAVDARPNEVAAWFAEAAKPQGELRMQPSWAVVLRAVDQRWIDLQKGVPADDDQDWREAREGRAKAIETLKRIGWYRGP